MPSRFEVDYSDPALAFEPLVDEVFTELKSSFLEMPRGDGFIDYATFEKGYQALKRATDALHRCFACDCRGCRRSGADLLHRLPRHPRLHAAGVGLRHD